MYAEECNDWNSDRFIYVEMYPEAEVRPTHVRPGKMSKHATYANVTEALLAIKDAPPGMFTLKPVLKSNMQYKFSTRFSKTFVPRTVDHDSIEGMYRYKMYIRTKVRRTQGTKWLGRRRRAAFRTFHPVYIKRRLTRTEKVLILFTK